MIYSIIIISTLFLVFFLIFQILRIVWNTHFIAKIILTALGGYIGFVLSMVIWPPSSFYIEEFQYRTKIDLPSSVKVISKSSTFPDLHGDYSAEAILQIDGDFTGELMKNLTLASDMVCSDSAMSMEWLRTEVTPTECGNIKRSEYSLFEWAINLDKGTLHYIYRKW